jgi:predicted glycoside hydrolase/deacetylase ChbG (UPF0249 family)
MKKLIINADDFGYTPGVSLGIIEAHNKGIVTSTTALAVSPYFKEAMVQAAKLAPTMGIGLHLALTLRHYKPVLAKEVVPSLYNEDGEFWNARVVLEKIDLKEVEMEWEAQILRFLESGQRPTHLDSHHNAHYFTQDLLNIALKLAKKYDLPLRNCEVDQAKNQEMAEYYGSTPTTAGIMQNFYAEGVSYEMVETIFDQIKNSDEQVFEMNCHPAFIDPILEKVTSYLSYRTQELEILTSDKVKAMLEERNIRLTTFKVFG